MNIWFEILEAIFSVGVFINALLFVPQILRLWRRKNSDDVSLLTFAGFNVLNILTVVHGAIRDDNILFIGFMCSVTTNTVLTLLIIFYRVRSQHESKVSAPEPSEINLDDLLSCMPGHVYWVDRKNTFGGCNDRQAIDCGYKSRLDLVGKNVVDFQTPENYATIVANNNRVFQFGEVVEGEEPFLDSSGKVVVYYSKKVPLKDAQGNITGLLGMSLDITAQKELAEKLLEIERLEKENERLELERTEQEKRELELELKAQEDFRKIVFQANHDITSPLLVLDLFADKYLEIIPEEQRNSVRNSIDRIRGIASSMLIHFDMGNSSALKSQSTKSEILTLPL